MQRGSRQDNELETTEKRNGGTNKYAHSQCPAATAITTVSKELPLAALAPPRLLCCLPLAYTSHTVPCAHRCRRSPRLPSQPSASSCRWSSPTRTASARPSSRLCAAWTSTHRSALNGFCVRIQRVILWVIQELALPGPCRLLPQHQIIDVRRQDVGKTSTHRRKVGGQASRQTSGFSRPSQL